MGILILLAFVCGPISWQVAILKFTGHDKSKFGIPVEQLDRILAMVEQYNIHINDLHIHTGSDIKDADVFVKGIEVLFDIIPHFKELKSIDLVEDSKYLIKGDAETDMDCWRKK